MREESEGGEEAEVDKCIGWKLEMCIGEYAKNGWSVCESIEESFNEISSQLQLKAKYKKRALIQIINSESILDEISHTESRLCYQCHLIESASAETIRIADL